MINAGTIAAVLMLNAEPFANSLNAAKNQLSVFGNDTATFSDKVKGLSGALQGVGQTMTMKVSAPIAAVGGTMIKTASDFDSALSSIKAVSGASSTEMDKLRTLALQMGKDTSFSAKEAAVGIEELMKAGLSTGQVLEGGLAGALSLAAAGEIELGDAAEIASTALNAFKSDNLSVAQAADILAGAANASATDVGEMKYGLASVSAVASSVGLSFSDTSTALAVFAQNGLKGSDAGTSLKTMLMNLQPQTKAQKQLFDELGLAAADGSSKFYDAQGNLKSIDEIAGLLQSSMKDLTAAQRQQAMETMFGSDAIRAGNILFKEGAQGIDTMREAMAKVGAEQTAATKMDNFAGSVEEMKGSIETLGIQMGTLLLPKLRELVDGITGVVNKFLEMSPATQGFIVKFALIAAAVGPVLLVLGTLSKSLISIKGAFDIGQSVVQWATGLDLANIKTKIMTISQAAFNAVMNANPIVLVITLIGALVAALIYLYNNNETVRNAIQAAWEGIKTVAVAVFTFLSDFFSGWGEAIKTFFTNLWTAISNIFSSLIEGLKTIVSNIFNAITSWFSTWGESLKQWFTNVWNGIKIVWEVAINGIKELVSTVFNAIKDFFTPWGEALKMLFTNVWNGIKIVFSTAFEAIKTLVTTVWNGIKLFWDTWSNSVKLVFTTLWNGVKTIFTTVFEAIKGFCTNFANGITNIFNTAKGAITKVWETLWNGVKNFVTTIWDAITGGIKGAINTIVDSVTWLWDKITGIFDGIIGIFKNAWNWLTKWNSAKVDNKSATYTVNEVRTTTSKSGSVPGYAVGTNYLPHDQLAMVHEGEAIIPKEFNPWANGKGMNNGNNVVINVTTNSSDRIVRELKYALGGGLA